MPVSHQHRCIFIHIPKCAGTSVEHALGIHGSWQEPDLATLFGHYEYHGRTLALQHLTVREMLDWDFVPGETFRSYFKFSIVRNPWERAVSDFLWFPRSQLVRALSLGLPIGAHPSIEALEQHLEEKSPQTFRLFLSCIRDGIEHDPSAVHYHFRPQYAFLIDGEGALAVDFVARFESLQKDFQHIAGRLGLDTHMLPKLNSSGHDSYHAYFNWETRRLVEACYGEDMVAFGYAF